MIIEMRPIRYYIVPRGHLVCSKHAQLYDLLLELGLPEGFKILDKQKAAHNHALHLLVEHSAFDYSYLPDGYINSVPTYHI